MSGLLLIHHRDASPVPVERFQGCFAHLDTRGLDGRAVRWLGDVALGHQHRWTTPEEVGESQPLVDPGSEVWVAFEGRLDNRDELIAALEARPTTSDARLVLASYRRWEEGCLGRLLGPFALVLYDSPRRRLLCGRDALGDRTLFYTATPRLFLAASEEVALRAHPKVSDRLDETTLARYFAVEAPEPGSTFFADIRELPPGHGLMLENGRLRTWRHWRPDPEHRHRFRHDLEVAEGFRELLAASVRCRLRSPSPVAVLMSGGLDSTSIAALAARELAARRGERLRTVSWIFDELTSCDERRFIHPVVHRLDLDSVEVPGDGAWPLQGLESWPVSPGSPTTNPYRRLLDGAYGAARERGSRVVLTGWSGDHLYTGAAGWLASLLAERRFSTAAFEVARHLIRRDDRRRLRGAVAELSRRRRGGADRSALDSPPWLTDHARERWGGPPVLGPGDRRPMIEGIHLWNGIAENAHAHRAGVEVRCPYRDRRLVEYCLALPAHHLYRHGRIKHVLREAMRGLLPEEVRHRHGGTLLTPLFERGVFERERGRVGALLLSGDPLWRTYVRETWLTHALDRGGSSPMSGIEAVVLWHCLSLELWYRGRSTPGVGPSLAGRSAFDISLSQEVG